jgi:hypothetical protein
VVALEGPHLAVGRGHGDRHRLARGEVGQALGAEAIVLTDPVVVGRVGEGDREDALLLQVGLVDPGEGPGHDQDHAPEAGLHGRVLPGGALTHVLVADDGPRLTGLVVRLGDVGEAHPLAGELVLAHADDALVEGADRPQVEVAGDVLQVAPVLEPRAGHRDVVGRELALGLDPDREVLEVPSVPGRERLEELEAVRGGGDRHLDAGAVLGRGDEAALAGVEPGRGQLDALGHVEADLGAVGRGEGVAQGVEVDPAGQSQGHHRLR